MTTFSADWLALREPYDSAARNGGLEAKLSAWATGRDQLDIVDLGSGTGANLRHLASRLPVPQRWVLVEQDRALIETGSIALPATSPARYRWANLTSELEAVLDGPVDFVTCSALLDLVSAEWLGRLVRLVVARRCALLAVLTIDGRVELQPPLADDPAIGELVDTYQRSLNGFGRALGATAGVSLVKGLSGASGELLTAPSDWQLGPGDQAMQQTLIDQWADAAAEVDPDDAERIQIWRQSRLDVVASGTASCRVGHMDMLWLPPATARGSPPARP